MSYKDVVEIKKQTEYRLESSTTLSQEISKIHKMAEDYCKTYNSENRQDGILKRSYWIGNKLTTDQIGFDLYQNFIDINSIRKEIIQGEVNIVTPTIFNTTLELGQATTREPTITLQKDKYYYMSMAIYNQNNYTTYPLLGGKNNGAFEVYWYDRKEPYKLTNFSRILELPRPNQDISDQEITISISVPSHAYPPAQTGDLYITNPVIFYSYSKLPKDSLPRIYHYDGTFEHSPFTPIGCSFEYKPNYTDSKGYAYITINKESTT